MEIQGRSELARNEAAPLENEVLYLDKARWLLKYEQILSNRDVYIYIYIWSKVRVIWTANEA